MNRRTIADRAADTYRVWVRWKLARKADHTIGALRKATGNVTRDMEGTIRSGYRSLAP